MSVIEQSADIVVAGGGLAGTFAAISAARMGCQTVLIQDRPVLGGNASSELFVGVCGADSSGGAPWTCVRETGLISEFALELACRSASFTASIPLHSVVLWEMARREPKLALYLNTSVRGVTYGPDGSVQTVDACQLTTERDYRFSGNWFIDCTGHGSLGAAAGAEFRMGREARSEFGESMAPEVADARTMGASVLFRARDMGRPVPFVAPEWAARFPDDSSLPFRHPAVEKVDQASDEMVGFWWVEYGGCRHTIHDAEAIRDELLRVVFGVWDHMKNTGDHGVANYAITHITPILGHRESRRFVGDLLLTEEDIRGGRVFPDQVAYGGWPIDLHPPEGIYGEQPPCTSVRPPLPYTIPFRCLYSRNVPNLLFAGRNVSVTHVALGSTRVMATCALMGQAAGTAAALCQRHGQPPRVLGQQRIHELQQQLLKDDCHLIGVPNEDPDDRARDAVACASSEAPLEIETVHEWFDLACDSSQVIPVSAPRIDVVELYLRSDRDEPAEATVDLQPARTINDWMPGDSLAQAMAVVPPRYSGWVRFELRQSVLPRRMYRLRISGAPGLWLGVQGHPASDVLRGSRSAGGGGAWRVFPRVAAWGGHRGAFLVRLTPPSRPYAAANVLSGINRPYAWTNRWMSDPRNPLPQWIELEFPEPVDVASVHLTFDDDLDSNLYLPPPWGRLGHGVPPTLVRDYGILTLTEAGWQCVADVTGNHQRHRVHRVSCPGVRVVRLECRATHGVPEARVYEMRAYAQS